MVNGILYVYGKPTNADAAPDRFKAVTTMQNLEMSVERISDDEGNSAIEITFYNKAGGRMVCCFSLNVLRTREFEPGEDKGDGTGAAVYKDLNDLEWSLSILHWMILNPAVTETVKIEVNLDFLNSEDMSRPMIVTKLVPDDIDYVNRNLPFTNSYMKYKGHTEMAAEKLIEEEK